MPSIKVTPLGAGQDVGRSCILVTIGGRHIMLDCGMHMSAGDQKKFPDFEYITSKEKLDDYLDCVLISHFHLDHCGALPHLTEVIGYNGPVFMTHPTKAVCPLLLEDFRKVAVERKGDTSMFNSAQIQACMAKVTPLGLNQCVNVGDIFIKVYYAGHVLGAAMFYVRVGEESLVYTGDYNMTPDRHLGSAWIDRCRPDVLITESTYATTIRDSKRIREREFLKKVHTAVARGGKVLIPVFALGRAQELCILLDSYWDRMGLTAPVYFSAGLTEKATNYYKLFITWMNEKVQKTFVERNMFEYKHISTFERAFADNPGPMVVFASPGMLHAGLSLQLFRKWAPDPKNMVILPGFCVSGTVGNKILSGVRKIEFFNPKETIDVKLDIEYLSFSAHADAKGIMQLIRMCAPRHVLLVHGEAVKMGFLQKKVEKEYGVPCLYPANGETASIPTPDVKNVLIDKNVMLVPPMHSKMISRIFDGIVIVADEQISIVSEEEAARLYSLNCYKTYFTEHYSFSCQAPPAVARKRISREVSRRFGPFCGSKEEDYGLDMGSSQLASPHLLIDVTLNTDTSDAPKTFVYDLVMKWEDGLVEADVVDQFIEALSSIVDVHPEEGEIDDTLQPNTASASDSDSYTVSDAEQEYGCLLPLKKRTADDLDYLYEDYECVDEVTTSS
ncbi:integrator complex subunit 11-like [Paramacrobiotus metropolitanus]|uniref:integrator complex subunit 11-like n=1 Tax=Paramacrobiotus metropolitanus TaxID=2943436 RepID=UPI0024465413|nr:integrator complex subunit 11-like [Paramacrobiotus metropolitanus]